MKATLTQSMAWLHSWAGIIAGWLLFAIALTGTLTFFKPEISDWMHPEVHSKAEPIPALVAAIKYLDAHADHTRPWRLLPPDDRTDVGRVFYYTKSADEKKATYHDRAYDAVTGSPEGIRDTKGGEFFYRFHFQLQIKHPYGRVLAVLAGVTMLVAIISGILTHKRIFTDFFVFRPGVKKRSFLDAHNVMAVFALPFHLMITFTGVLTLITLMFPWALLANYGEDRDALEADIDPGHVHRKALGEPAQMADIESILRRAESMFDGGRVGVVTIENAGDKNATVMVERHDGDNVAYRVTQITFDGPTGDVLQTFTEDRPARRVYDTLYGLHMGRFAAPVVRWLYYLSGLSLCAVILTGLIIWSLSRADDEKPIHRIVARLSAGTTMGLMMAVPAFFWANRLLPAEGRERIQTEMDWFFIVWAIGIVWAFFRKPSQSWMEQSAVAAVIYITLPVASAALTGRGLWSGIGLSDGLFFVFDASLTLTGLALGALAYYMRQRTHRVPALQPAPAE